MKKILTLLTIWISVVTGVLSQDLLQLHPVVGDTIDSAEKMAFYLFPEIKDTAFIQGVIYAADSSLYVNITEKNKAIYKLDINLSFLKEYRKNIEKLAMYYAKMAEVDSTRNLAISDPNSVENKSPEFKLNAEERKKLVKDSRRYWRKKDKAEDLGLWGVDKDNYIESSSHTNIFKAKVRF